MRIMSDISMLFVSEYANI